MNITRLTFAAGALLAMAVAALASQPSIAAAVIKVPPIVEAVGPTSDTATCGVLGAARDLSSSDVSAVKLADPALANGGASAVAPDGRGGYSCLVIRGVHTVDA